MKMFLRTALLVGVSSLTAAPAVAQDGNRDITVATAIRFDNIDACNTSSEVGSIVQENVVETLTQLDPVDGSPHPRLALSWEQTEPTVWRVTLREGVTFQDGEAFNADAVVAAINRMFNPDLDCLNRLKLFNNIPLTPTAVDEHTVDISTDLPQVLMPVFLSFLAIDSPNTDTSALSNQPVGTGPYTVGDRRPGEDVILTRWDGYWGDAPEVEKVTFTQRDESALRAAMVEVGEADIGMNLAVQDATNPETDFAYQNGETTRMRFTWAGPLTDIRVRQAFNLAIDREGIRDALFTPDFQIATQLFLPRINGYNPDLEPWAYDPDRARELLEEARADGVDVDAEIPIIGRINHYANSQEALEAMVAMWQDVGLNVRLDMIERAQWLQLVNKPFGEDRPAMLISEQHDNTSGDATFTMQFRYHTDGQQSEISFPELDALIDAADAASGEERVRLFQEANRLSYEEIVPDVLMFHMVNFMRISPRLDFRPDTVTGAMFEIANIHFND
jgi:peptide/nickel transport system substrate-binding protein